MLNFKIDKKVFKPTGTTELLLNSSLKKIKRIDDILDLGCGSGIVGINIAKIKKIKKKFISQMSRNLQQ